MGEYNKNKVSCDKCRHFFEREDLIIGNHGKLCIDCFPHVRLAHAVTFYKLSKKRSKEDGFVDFKV